jgi:hypothetical protein
VETVCLISHVLRRLISAMVNWAIAYCARVECGLCSKSPTMYIIQIQIIKLLPPPAAPHRVPPISGLRKDLDRDQRILSHLSNLNLPRFMRLVLILNLGYASRFLLHTRASFSSEKFLAKMSHRMFRAISEGVFGYKKN